MIFRSKKGFTLVELMVVMAIIGILAASLVVAVRSIGPAGRAVRCKNNLRNLAQAALAYAAADEGWGHRLPWAGSYEHVETWLDNDLRKVVYRHRVGWVSCTWSGGSPWPQEGGGAPAERWFQWDNSRGQSLTDGRAQFHGDREKALFSLTNGTLWKYVGKNIDAYICDEHKIACKGKTSGEFIARSYVMNAYFGMDYRDGGPVAKERSRHLNSLAQNADKLLMFAELPAATEPRNGKFTGGPEVRAGQHSDGVLDARIKNYYYNSATEEWINYNPSTREKIGFNHTAAGRPVAHVAFSDGHVGVVGGGESPEKYLTDEKLEALTCLLCNGADIPAKSDDWKKASDDYK